MNSPKRLFTIALATCGLCLFAYSSVDAHDFLKTPLQERYGLKSVSCSACHPGSNKAINNAFGLKFKAAFKGKNYTKRVHDAKALKKTDKEAGEKALAAIDKEMVADFNAAIGEIETQTMTFADLVKMGLLNGTKLEKDVVEQMGKDQGVADH